MNRSNSWKSLEKIFATRANRTPRISKTKFNKNADTSKYSAESDECKIDDSDEENMPSSRNHSKIIHNPKIKRKPREVLTLNTTINTSVLDSSRISSSDTDDEINCEPELYDVSDIKTPQNRFKRNRFQSLTFLSVQKTNHSTVTNRRTCDTSNKSAQHKQSWSIKRNAFNNNNNNNISNNRKTSTNLDDTIIESDSTDDSKEKSPPKKCRNKNGFRPLTMDIASNFIIDTSTPSTQQSFKFDSPTNFTPKDKKLTKLKGIKGGLLERLTKAISRTKSDYSFWMNERCVDLIEPGDKLCIEKIEQSYGRILLYCSASDDANMNTFADANDAAARANDDNVVNIKCDQYTKVLCIDPAYKRLSTLQVGKTIEVVLESTEYVIQNNLCFYPYVSKILS